MSYSAEQGDLYELFGNLIDNAWKWCRSSVRVTVAKDAANQLIIVVEDDGPGVSQADTEAILSRGNRGRARGDIPGQGIGLAVVAELIGLYRGEISIDRGKAGGAQVKVILPAR